MSKTYVRKDKKGVRGRDRRAARADKRERTHAALKVERMDDLPQKEPRR